MSLLRFRPRCDTLRTLKARFQAGIDGPRPRRQESDFLSMSWTQRGCDGR